MSTSPPTVTREAGTSRPARRPVRRRISTSHLLIGVVVVLAFLLNFLALQDRRETTMVAVADRALVAGSVLSVSDLRFVPIPADFEGMPHLLSEDAASEYEGWVIRRSVTEGEVLGPALVVDPGAAPGLRSMSIPVAVEHAVGGSLVAGDRVDFISVDDQSPFYVAVDVEVLDVSVADRGSLGGLGDYHIVVAVDADQALALAAAIDSGSIEVVRSTGAVAVVPGTGTDGDS